MNQNKKLTNFIRVLLLAFALVLPIAFAPEVQAAGSVKSVAVTNLPAKTLTLKKGKSMTLKVKVTTTGKASKNVTFKSSKKSVATVSSKGKITAKKNGKTNITITSKANKKKKVTISVTVGTPSTKVALNKTKVNLGKGKKVTLKATVTPKNASNKKVVWTSSKKSVATVSSKGVVTGKKAGTAKITATAADGSGKKATCTVKVGSAVTKVALDKTSLNMWVGGSETLKATVSPSKAVVKTVEWSSSNPAVATVEKGKVTALSAGTATITAKATDGSGKKATCVVMVGMPVNVAGASVLNPGTIAVTLTGAQDLTAANFTVKTKAFDTGSYNKTCSIDAVTTENKTVYTITLADSSRLAETQKVQVTVNGLNGTGTATAETTFEAKKFDYTEEQIFRCEYNKKMNESLEFDNRAGYITITKVENLPEGVKYEVAENGCEVDFYGTPTKKGVTVSTVAVTDELGSTITSTVSWLVYADDTITAAYYPQYEVLNSNGEAYIEAYIYEAGGSGRYNYSIEAGKNEGLTIDSDGEVYGTLKVAKNYTIPVTVTDANNPNTAPAQVSLVINVIDGVSIGGMVRDAYGKAIEYADVYFENKDQSNRYLRYRSVKTDDKGMFSIKVPAGTYDIQATSYDVNKYLSDQSLTTSRSGFDIELPLYRVDVLSNDGQVDPALFGTWYDEKNVSRGHGGKLYLKEGSYTLTSEGGDSVRDITAELTINVNPSSKPTTVTATVKTVKESDSVKGTLTLDAAPVSVPADSYGYYYKFVPAADGDYCFWLTGDEGYIEDFYRMDPKGLTSIDTDYTHVDDVRAIKAAGLKAGQTYYIEVETYDAPATLAVRTNLPEPKPEDPDNPDNPDNPDDPDNPGDITPSNAF